MSNNLNQLYEFDGFVVNPARRLVMKNGETVPLTSKVFDTLLVLVENWGRVVEKEKLMQDVWAGAAVEEVALAKSVSALRRALGEVPGEHRFIATVPGKGYQFVASVRSISPEPVTAPPGRVPAEETEEIVIETHTISRMLSKEDVVQPPVELPPHSVLTLERPKARIPARSALILGASVLVTLASILFFMNTRSAARQFSLTSLTTNDSENRVTAAAISSDGKWVAYSDSNGIWLRVLNGGATQQLSSPPELRAEHMSWFSDGLRLVVSGFHTTTLNPQIWIISITGQPPRLLREGARNGVPSPDGTQVAMTRNRDTEIWLEGAMGEEPRRLPIEGELDTFPFLLWSPDGKRLIYQRQRRASTDGRIRRDNAEINPNWRWDYESADIVSGKVLASTPDLRFNSAGILSNGGMFLMRRLSQHSGDTLWEVDTNPVNGAFRSPPRLVSQLGPNKFGLTVSSDGAKMAMVAQKLDYDIYVANVTAGPSLQDAKRLTLNRRAGYPHAWTTDSQAVIFEAQREDRFHLYIQRPDERTVKAISPTAMHEILPQSSPDGKWLLYAGTTRVFAEHDFSLFRKPIAGGASLRIPIQGKLDEFRCPVSGVTCVLRVTVGREEYRYFGLDPITGQGPELARTAWLPGTLGDWDVAPDRSAVAIPDHNPANRKIRVVPLGAGGAKLAGRDVAVGVTGTLSSLAWAPGGKGWYVAAQSDAGYSLWYVSLQGQSHFLREAAISTWPVPSPDGRKLAFVDQTGDGNVWLLQ